MILVDPLRTGGAVPDEVKRRLLEFVDGYSVCAYCQGDLHKITKPNIKSFIEELREWLKASEVRLTHGARESFFALFLALYKSRVKEGKAAPIIIVDGNTHYSLELAAERAMFDLIKTEVGAYPEYKIIEEDYENKILEVKRKYGLLPALLAITYPDGHYGNFSDIKKISKIAKDYNIPIMVNGAYLIGRVKTDMEELNVDALVASGHKSMASSGPIGLLALNEELSREVLKRSELHKDKEVELLGCTVRGLPVISLMLSFPYVKRRVEKWEEKVEIARYFINKAEELGLKLLGERPHNHDLMLFETPQFYEISIKRKDRFFLYKELKKRGIIGIKPGITKVVKLSTYLLNREEADFVVSSFKEILEEG